jgi:hypothetical protein
MRKEFQHGGDANERRIKFAPADKPLLEPEDLSTRIRIILREWLDQQKDKHGR